MLLLGDAAIKIILNPLDFNLIGGGVLCIEFGNNLGKSCFEILIEVFQSYKECFLIIIYMIPIPAMAKKMRGPVRSEPKVRVASGVVSMRNAAWPQGGRSSSAATW